MIYRADQVSACFADGSCLTVVSGDVPIEQRKEPDTMLPGGPNKIWVIAALIALGALIFFARLHTYNEPLERDITTYAVIGHEILNGKTLYSGMWDHKPPAVHVTYAAAEFVAGYGRRSIFLLTVATTLATLMAVYFAGSAFGAGRLGGLTAAAVWTMVSGDLYLEANQPNTEVFLNACLTGAFAVIVGAKSSDLEKWRTAAAGALFLLASLYKHVAIVPAFAVTLIYVLSAPAGSRKQAMIDMARIGAVGALGWVVVFGYFGIRGRTDSFIDAVFTYNQFYAGSIAHNLESWFRLPPLPPHALILGLSLTVITLIGMVFGLFHAPRRPWVLLLGAMVATHIAVLLPGQFFAHYYQLWLPPLVIGTGWTMASFRRVLPAKMPWPAYVASAATVIGFGAFQFPEYLISADQWSIRKYDRIFVETDRAALTLNKLLKPNERFYEWGSETGLYFLTGKEPPSGIIFCEPLMLGPLKTELLQRLEDDLDREKPELVVLEEETVRRQPLHPFIAWMKRDYRLIHSESRFWFLARKGTDLDREASDRITRLE